MDCAPPEPGRISALAKFDCPSLEQDFRRKYLPDDIRLGYACAAVVLLSSVSYLISGYKHYGISGQYSILASVRGFAILATFGFVWALRHCNSPRRLEASMIALCLIVGTGNLITLATGANGAMGHALMSLGVPLITYCVMPMPFARQFALALPFSIVSLLIAAWAGAEPARLTALTGAFVTANTVGAFASWQMNHRRRQIYLASVRETELRGSLEQALAEVKTLRGLLRICAWCKRIHSDEEEWQSVESYVQNHSHAEFTHGICDHCLRDKFGEVALERITA